MFSFASSRRLSFSEQQAQHSRLLKELQRRHNEFRRLLLGGQGALDAGPTFLTSSPTHFLLPGSEGLVTNKPVSTSSDSADISTLHIKNK